MSSNKKFISLNWIMLIFFILFSTLYASLLKTRSWKLSCSSYTSIRNILYATCNKIDGTPMKTSINLEKCFSYDEKKKSIVLDKNNPNMKEKGCSYVNLDHEKNKMTVNCPTCRGVQEIEIPLEKYVHNINGELQCFE